jgi:hypothetical protein
MVGDAMENDIEYAEEYDIPESSFMPFGGLLKPTIYNRILMEIVADPYRTYTPGQMVEILHSDRSKVGKALSDLEALGILRNISLVQKRPVYEPRLESKRLQALTFLAYAVIDDRDGENSMERAIVSYQNGPIHQASQNECQGKEPQIRTGKGKNAVDAKV